MAPWRFRILYYVLLPAICVAAGILGYYTWVSASYSERLGEQTIAANTLLLVREKVETIEQYVISQDNLVFRLLNLNQPELLETTWRPIAADLTPSVHSVVVFDDTGEILGLSSRGNAEEKREFLADLERRIARLDPESVVRLRLSGEAGADLLPALGAVSLRSLAPPTMNLEVRWRSPRRS